MEIKMVDLEVKEPILMVNEEQRDIIRAAASGEFSQEDIKRKRNADETHEIADRIDRAVWEVIKINPDAFHSQTVFKMAAKFYKKDLNEDKELSWQQ